MSAPICPRCQVAMEPITGYPDTYQCPLNPEHTTDVAGPPPQEEVRRVLTDATGLNYTAESWSFAAEAERFIPPHLKDMKLFGPLTTVRMASNQTDGSYCLPLGSTAPGGGSKSGRRKKNSKGGKKFTDTPWGSDKT